MALSRNTLSSQKPNWVDIGTLIVLFLAFIAAVIAAWEAKKLAKAAHDQLSVALKDESPFVSLKDIDFIHDSRSQSNDWIMVAEWQNSGKTATTDMSIKVNYLETSLKLPSNFANCDYQTTQPRISLGGQTAERLSIASVPNKGISDFNSATGEQFFVWGWAKYADGLGKQHETRFCWSLNSVNEHDGTLKTTHGICGDSVGNCIDGECKKDDAQYPPLGSCTIANVNGTIVLMVPKKS